MEGAVREVLAHLERRDAEAAVATVERLLERAMTPSRVIQEVLAPAQRTVGERWASGAWTVAQEHAATAVVDDLLGRLARELPAPSAGAPVVARVGEAAHALGLDAVTAWVADAARILDRWLDTPPPLDGPPAELAEARDEAARLGARIEELASDSLAQLGDDGGGLTRAELVEALQFVEAALTADDPSVWRDHRAWLAARFEARGVPAEELDRVLATLAEVVGEALPCVRALLSGRAGSTG